MKQNALKLQLVGEVRSPARKVKLTMIASYGQSRGKMSFLGAHRKSQEQDAKLVSIRTGVRLIHALSNARVYGEIKELKDPKGILISTPGLEMFVEDGTTNLISEFQQFAFWSGGLLVSSGGRKFGSQIVMGPHPWCKEKSVFQVPRELENAKGISLIYEPGSWSFYQEEKEILYIPKENARPVWIPEAAGKFDLSVLDKGTDLSSDEVPPDITIFVYSRSPLEWLGPVLCTLASNDHKSIRISAMLPPTFPMGAILEMPWEGIREK